MTHNLPTTPQKSAFPVGAELVRSPTKNEMAASITLLFDAFSSSQRDAPERVAAAYVMALSEFSAWSIRAGIVKLVRGEYPDLHEGNWLPSTAIVCRAIRRAAESSPETKERLWRQRLDHWRDGNPWNPHWAQGPEEPAFPHLCPPHLLADFEAATCQRNAGKAA